MGTKLAEKIKKHIADDDIDVVIPIPESSITSGVKVAEVLNKEIAFDLLRIDMLEGHYYARTRTEKSIC